MTPPRHVVVCGAGVVGASAAYFLARRGVAVTVVERMGVACAASGKSGGFLALDWCAGSELDALARRSFALHAELPGLTGRDWGWRGMTTYAGFASARGTRLPASAHVIDWLSRAVAVDRPGRLDVDPPVPVIDHGPGGRRQVGHAVQPVPEPAGQVGDHPLAERPPGVPHLVEQVLRGRVDLAEVVVALAHLAAQLGVGATGLLGGGQLFGGPPGQFLVQPDQGLQHVGAEVRTGADGGQPLSSQ